MSLSKTVRDAQWALSDAENGRNYREALERLLSVKGDHMAACDRTMGASHPCTCGALQARSLLREVKHSLPPRIP